jgi:cobalt-zinc-cadmium efflux system outer membrane protein
VIATAALLFALRIDELERMAVERNPAVARAEAQISASEGRKRQAGAYPNPVVGLNADEVNGGETIRYGEWGGFASQQIVTAGKRGLDRNIAGRDVASGEGDIEGETTASSTPRACCSRALADQRLHAHRTRVYRSEHLEDLRELANVGRADQPNVLAAVEEQRAELGLQMARNAQVRTWRQISALVDRTMTPQPLEGDLDALPKIDIGKTLDTIEKQSPDIEQARSVAR